ncbi:MAG: DUF1697 domain-containing protein [Bacteroidales bacterium]
MGKYISILRGINVSGQKIIKMNDLKSLYELLGFSDVETYIQSGNVIFSASGHSTNDTAELIMKSIEDKYGFQVPVIVMTQEYLEKIIRNNPLIKDKSLDQSFMHITFLAGKPANPKASDFEERLLPAELIHITPEAVYLYCPAGYGQTKLNNTFIEKKLGTGATTRNLKTANELLRLAT